MTMTKQSELAYNGFIESKSLVQIATGFKPENIGQNLLDFHAAIVEWACKRGRAAIFADTGLWRTTMQADDLFAGYDIPNIVNKGP
jgi:hypothetical protein